MKKLLAVASILLISSTYASASPSVFAGVTYGFGGGVGLSLKALSTDKEDSGVLSGGVTYYPLTNKFGASIGGGYLVKNGATTVEWDFLNGLPTFSAGYAHTKDDTPAPMPI